MARKCSFCTTALYSRQALKKLKSYVPQNKTIAFWAEAPGSSSSINNGRPAEPSPAPSSPPGPEGPGRAGKPAGSSSPPARTEHRAAWSRHLQLAQHPPKCPTTRRHSGNGRGPNTAPLQALHGLATASPRDWMRMAFMYDGRCVDTWAGVIEPRTNSTSWPGSANTARACLL
jgi:hypothetical protein